jgi:hypothetical protein
VIVKDSIIRRPIEGIRNGPNAQISAPRVGRLEVESMRRPQSDLSLQRVVIRMVEVSIHIRSTKLPIGENEILTKAASADKFPLNAGCEWIQPIAGTQGGGYRIIVPGRKVI